MLRALRVIKTKVRFVPAPCFSRMQSTSENNQQSSSTRPTSSKTKSYAPQNLPIYDYDLVVVGGGSGGLAAAKEAAKLNKNAKVACFDFVTPTYHGTKWGLGGTCVNVGCIPKKLMHYAGSIGNVLHRDAAEFGWQNVDNGKHDWSTMQSMIGNYIKSLNFSYKVQLRSANVTYLDGLAQFIDPHTIEWKSLTKSGRVTFNQAIIATGGRPSYGNFPGRELCISSDDIFWLKKNPGKTLIIGAAYIALECASFLHHIGNDVTVMIRSRPLRTMDHQCGEMICELMERDGLRFIMPANPRSFSATQKPDKLLNAKECRPGVWEHGKDAKGNNQYLHESGAIEVQHPDGKITWIHPKGEIEVKYEYADQRKGKIHSETYDTILLAIGRTANIADLGLDTIGVDVVNGKVLVDEREQTNLPHIYALGDVATGVIKHGKDLTHQARVTVDRPELTPVAIQAGQYLARRLWNLSNQLMNYRNIPSTVFTSPSEYSFVGLHEEQAMRSQEDGGIGAENVRIYWSRFGNIEISPIHPHIKKTQSECFTGNNTWAHQYALKNNTDWPEVTYDLESANYVVYNGEVNGQKNTGARIINKYRNEQANNKITYDIEIQNEEKTVIQGVTGEQLQLQEEQQLEKAEVFYKANCLAKLICDKSQNDKVVGLHFMGPNAGEVVQGYALAIMMGATKQQFDELVGIHPTAAEEFTVLSVTKESEATLLKAAGCGGGSCG
ncbi:unnamed protein product [Rotaria magnacalcarata]|uniref:thioredoxin-disulfide reductase (NADPH) n=9 Tax=Rotaria magnacalcarata TaxID=392030 RepID=A0A815XD47_9BILA|nr:unnamed protein product [Rotaria magnacalcarata]CAF1555938.1 unnamed protein product [Rotaria magnacalcarata]CAF2096354.1 unnamed protein product [Rotaria magnacalcarata]